MDGYLINIHGKKKFIKQGIKVVNCSNNQLTKLVLPDGVKEVYCSDNQITKLNLLDGIEEVWCDKTVLIKNIDRFIGNDDVKIRFV